VHSMQTLPNYFDQPSVVNVMNTSWPATMWGPAIVMVPTCQSVRLSVCHIQISPELSVIDVWLLGNSYRNPGFPIQNLPSDSRSEVLFRVFPCWHFAHSDRNGQLS